jgi:tetratricopeptide (TPR) repeat protein/serine/threonine protein kinase
MNASPRKAREVFLAAVKLPAEQRQAYLQEICGGDEDLYRRVHDLLQAHAEIGSFREALDERPPVPVDQPVSEAAGMVIGPYTLLEPIGEGGMGTVWLAQQTQPVKRLVAVKLIKVGMDSKQVIARFEAERQALALMDHPHIARVHDGGTTTGEPGCVSAGRPYFVMELVKGLPITRYCDEHQLTPVQRLELFVPVCQAVQHAHQKGIIHRDIKPSNVLVALYDGKPVPKVIDFGVAKATGTQLTERTLFTAFGVVLGTLEYMSPEQAELNQLDIDTRSDIYSLGVLLYELLTGTTPLDRERLKEAALLEALRLIREEEAPRPSTRLSSTEALPCIAVNRGLEPKKLSSLVRGELDWIVMKCLEKDRNRRYETAGGLAQDIDRYLHDEAVQACPPSAGYRLRKFVRRHKGGLATAVLIGLMVLTALGVMAGSVGWVARDRAARQAVLEQEISRALDETEHFYQHDKLTDADAALKRAEGLVASGGGREELQRPVGRWRTDLDLVAQLEAIRLEAAAVKDEQFDLVSADTAYREAFRHYELDVEALDPEEAAQRIRAAVIRDRLVAALDFWIGVKTTDARPGRERLLEILRRADTDPWRDRLRQAYQQRDRETVTSLAQDPGVPTQPPVSVQLLGAALRASGDTPLAVAVLRQGQRRYPSDLWINHELAYCSMYLQPAQPGEAVGYYRVAVALRPESPGVHLNLARALEESGKLAEAEAELREAVHLKPDYSRAHDNLGRVLGKQGKMAEAEAEYREALRLWPANAWAYVNLGCLLCEHKRHYKAAITAFREAVRLQPKLADAHNSLGVALRRDGQPAEAEAAYREALRLAPKHANAQNNLGFLLARQGRYAEADAAYREALRLEPDDLNARINLAKLLRDSQRDFDGAIAVLRQGLRLKPNWAEGHHQLGLTLTQKGQLPEAEAAYREANRLQRGQVESHYALGVLLCDTKRDYDGAIAAFREVIRLEPNWAEAHGYLGFALSRKGKQTEATSEFREALRLKPDFAQSHYNLGQVLAAQGKLADAEAELAEALRLKPNDARAHHALGNVYARLARWDRATATFARAAELDPKNRFAWSGRAVTLVTLGDLAGYRRVCQAMLERLGKIDQPDVAGRTAQDCLLAPDSLADAERAVQLADRAVHAAENHREYPWFLLTRGLAEYRAGRPAEAVEWLKRRSLKSEDGRLDASAAAILAMAQHRLGQADAARAALGHAQAVLAQQMPDPARGRPFGDDWIGWAKAQILCREAEQLIRPK